MAGHAARQDGYVHARMFGSHWPVTVRTFPLSGGPSSPAPVGTGEEGPLVVMKVYSPEFKVDAVALYHSDPDLTIAPGGP